MDTGLLTKALNFHGQELYRLLDEEQGTEKLCQVDLRTVDYHVYRKRAKEFGFQERQRRQKLLRFIARKADMLYKPQQEVTFPQTFDCENEELCAVMSPLECFMGVPIPERRNYLYQCLQPGDVVISKLAKKLESGLVLTLVCMDGGKKREVYDLGVKVYVAHNHLPPTQSDNPTPAQVDDFMRGVITSAPATGKIMLSFREDMLPPEFKHRVKLGVIPEDEIPSHHKSTLANEGKTYMDVLQHTLSFSNPATALHMCNMLAVPLDRIASFIPELHQLVFTKEETATALRKTQSSIWAYKSVKEGVAYFKSGNNTEAFQCLNKALVIDPENVEALVARGALFANNNNLRRALEDFEEALSLNPNHANGRKYTSETLVALGKFYEDKMDITMARKTYRKAVQVDNQNASAREALLAVEALEKKKALEQKSMEYAPADTIPLVNQPGVVKKVSPMVDTRDKLKLLLKEEKKEKYKHERFGSDSSPPSSPRGPGKKAMKEETKWNAMDVAQDKKSNSFRNVDIKSEIEAPIQEEEKPNKRKLMQMKFKGSIKRLSSSDDKSFQDMFAFEPEKKTKPAVTEAKEESRTENKSLEDRLAMYYKKHGTLGNEKDSSESEKSHVSEDYRSMMKATKFSKKSKKQKNKKHKHSKTSSGDENSASELKKKKIKAEEDQHKPASPKVVFVMRKDDDLHYSKFYTHSAFKDDDDEDDQSKKKDGDQNEDLGKSTKKKKHGKKNRSSSISSSPSSGHSKSRSRSRSRSRSISSDERRKKKRKYFDSEDGQYKYGEREDKEKYRKPAKYKKPDAEMYDDEKYNKYEKEDYYKYNDKYYDKYEYDHYNKGYKYYGDYGYKYPKYDKYSSYDKYEKGEKYGKDDGYSSRYVMNDDKEIPKETKDEQGGVDAGKRYSYSSSSSYSKSRSKSRSRSHSKARSKSHSKSRSKSRSYSHSRSRSNSRSRSKSRSPSHKHRHHRHHHHRHYHHKNEKYQRDYHHPQRFFRGRRFFRQPFRFQNRGRFFPNRGGGFHHGNWKNGSGSSGYSHLISRAPSPETLKKLQEAAKRQKAIKAEIEREKEAMAIQKITKAVVMQNWADEENKSLEAAKAAAKKISESLTKNSGDEKDGKPDQLKEMESFLEQLKAQKKEKSEAE